MERLISNTVFGEYLNTKNIQDYEYRYLRFQYDQFLLQKLEFWQFVPSKLVEGFWVVLEEPNLRDCHIEDSGGRLFNQRMQEYQEAKDRVLFEGFECYVNNQIMSDNIIVNIVNNNFYFELVFEDKLPKSLGILNSIEDLVQCNLKLTASAKKTLGI